MKYLNKNFPNCKLNRTLRELYNNKQVINNSKLPEEEKRIKMKEIDNQIHRLWINHTYEDLKCD